MFPKRLKNQDGFTIVGAVVAGVIVIASAMAYSVSQRTAKSRQTEFRETFLAKSYATELVELFRSYDNASNLIVGYLSKKRPGQPLRLRAVYNLCEKVNVFDRAAAPKNAVAHPDTTADLPASPLDHDSAKHNAHRSYQVKIVDAVTLEENPRDPAWQLHCNRPATLPPGVNTLNALPKRALLAITVTVSWFPEGTTSFKPSEERKVEVSTILPILNRTTADPADITS